MNNQISSTQSLIEVKNLSFKRGERIIYDNVSLNIRRGQITAIMDLLVRVKQLCCG